MKTILSIDMDYIMSQYIMTYNDIVKGYEPQRWPQIEQSRHINDFVMYDSKRLQYITSLIFNAIKNNPDVKVHFLINHDAILNHLYNNGEQYDLINIDHHHDIFYHGKIDDQGNISNWVYWLGKNNQIVSYYWIGNPTSDKFNGKYLVPQGEVILPHDEEEVIRELPFFYRYTNLIDFSLTKQKFDEIFIVLSPEYIPPKFHHLFYMLQEIYEINTGELCPVDQSRYLKGE